MNAYASNIFQRKNLLYRNAGRGHRALIRFLPGGFWLEYEVVQPIGADHPEITARFRDPGGNVIGLYQERG